MLHRFQPLAERLQARIDGRNFRGRLRGLHRGRGRCARALRLRALQRVLPKINDSGKQHDDPQPEQQRQRIPGFGFLRRFCLPLRGLFLLGASLFLGQGREARGLVWLVCFCHASNPSNAAWVG